MRRHRRPLALCFLAIALLTVRDLAAQDLPYRAGFWLAGGVGVGGAALQCDGCAAKSYGGLSFSIRAGGTPSKSLLVGAEYNVAIHSPGGDELRTGYFGAITTYWYPDVAQGLFLKGGVGFSLFFRTRDNTLEDSQGGAVLVGAGYDLRVGRKISITPMLSLWRSSPASLDMDTTTIETGLRHSGVTLDVGVTFHSLLAGKKPPVERPQTRDDFWLGVGVGFANIADHCGGCTDGDHGAASGALRLGVTLSKKTLLGVELGTTLRPDTYAFGADTTFQSVSASYIAATVYWYPAASSGVFLKSGVGVSTYDRLTASSEAFNRAGAILVGAGYDVRIARWTSITPMLTLWSSTKADLKDGSTTVATGFRHTAASFQVGVTFH